LSRFFAFDGVDRSGKTTALENVHNRLNDLGIATRRLHGGHIGSVRVADFVGKCPDEVAYMLFWQAHRLLELTEIKHALDCENVVLCDRYVLSNLAYNTWTKLDYDFQWRMTQEYVKRCMFPDIYFVFTLPYELFLKRDDGDVKLDKELFGKIQNSYIAWALRLENSRKCKVVFVEGSRSEEAVSNFIMLHVRKELGLEEADVRSTI